MNVVKLALKSEFALLTGMLMLIQSPAGESVAAFRALACSQELTAFCVSGLGATSAATLDGIEVRERRHVHSQCVRTSAFDKCWPYFALVGSLTL